MKKEKKREQLFLRQAEQLIKSYKVETLLEKEDAWRLLMGKIEKNEQRVSRKISWYVTVAASVAATAAVLIALWIITSTVTINARQDETYTFRLPDNSRVILHNGSSLSYRKYFWNRDVTLLGEAYFEVEKGKGFRVKTGNGVVEVLGTRFLVNEVQNQLTVQCFEGKVKTSYNQNSWIIESGTRFYGSGIIGKKEIVLNANGYPGFAKFSKNFHDVMLSVVVNEIEQFFGVDIKIKEVGDKRFSGSIQTGSLENALQIVSEPLQLNYAFEDKYKIIVYKK